MNIYHVVLQRKCWQTKRKKEKKFFGALPSYNLRYILDLSYVKEKRTNKPNQVNKVNKTQEIRDRQTEGESSACIVVTLCYTPSIILLCLLACLLAFFFCFIFLFENYHCNCFFFLSFLLSAVDLIAVAFLVVFC